VDVFQRLGDGRNPVTSSRRVKEKLGTGAIGSSTG
jgi:hypothetical protein